MAGSSNNSVFIQVQGVLNEDWISSSNRKLTEVLEEIEKIEGVEIRFQRGTHVVLGTIDQLIKVQSLLLGKEVRASSTKEASKIPLKDLEMGRELKTGSHNEFTPGKTFAKTENPHEAQQPTELMVDRDIWEYIESKKQNDIRQMEDVFEAVITKVEDESGVLKLILKKKSHTTCNDNLELMLESLGELYGETAMGCVTEAAHFQLSDEERELAMEHVSAQFFEVLVKKCIYTNDVLFIGPLYSAREARQQFQTVTRRLMKGELRMPSDKWGYQSSYPKYPHEHTPDAFNPNGYEEAGLYDYQNLNRFNGSHNDYSSTSEYDRSKGMTDVYDHDGTKYQRHDVHEKHDFYDETSWKKKQGNDDVLESKMASHDRHLCDETGPKTKGGYSKTEDIISSFENLNLEGAHQDKDMIFQASKSNADDPSSSFSTELDEIQQQRVVATDSTALTKTTKKSRKVKSYSYDLPKVTIVKQKFEAVCDPSISNEPSVPSDGRKVETGRTGSQWKHDMEKKPYDSPSSSDSETHQKVYKRIQNAEAQGGQVGLGNGQEERDKKFNKDTEESASQETIRNVLQNVENPENKTNVKELVKSGTGNKNAADNLKITPPSALNKKEVLPQPADGTIACIIDKGFHLNGCPKSGTIEISMNFEAGIQGADQPEPGRPYQGMKLKAFLPASGDGREVLRLTKSAFAARKLFQIKRNEIEGENDVIVPNGVSFKESTDQFPDPEYLPSVIEQLKRLTE